MEGVEEKVSAATAKSASGVVVGWAVFGEPEWRMLCGGLVVREGSRAVGQWAGGLEGLRLEASEGAKAEAVEPEGLWANKEFS